MCLIFATITETKILFDGDASHDSKELWNVLNYEGDGNTIKAVNDEQYGKVWEFHKPKGAHRCEGHGAHGFTAKEGDDIYIGWRLKVHKPNGIKTNAHFQWKAYGDDMQQNYPITVNTGTDLHLNLDQFDPGKIHNHLWTSSDVVEDKWNSIVLRINVSRDIKKGFIELWFNGKQQNLHEDGHRFICRTLDAEHCDPKWGVYGGDDGDITAWVGQIKIATTYEEAAPK